MNARLMGRPARAVAALGALVAAGAVTLVATVGTANAAGAGRCTDNVNVRDQPDISARIVAVCERGQAVQVGQTRNGFVQLTDLKGWAAQEFVSVNGHTGAAPATPRTTSAQPTPASTAGRNRGSGSDAARHHSSVFDEPTDGDTTATPTAAPTDEAEPSADTTDASTTDDPNAVQTTGDAQAAQPSSAAGGLSRLLG